jgi:hypothetical protein
MELTPWSTFEKAFADWTQKFEVLFKSAAPACLVLRKQYDGELAANAGYRADALMPSLNAEERREFLRIAGDELNDHARTEKRLLVARGCPLPL